MKFLLKNGFSLLELVVSVGILVLIISSIYFTIISCILLNQSNHNLSIAVNDAQRILEQIKQIPFEEIKDYIPPQFNHLINETITVDKNIQTRIAEITVNVKWDEGKRRRNFSLFTKINR